jgi:hypothetical protein
VKRTIILINHLLSALDLVSKERYPDPTVRDEHIWNWWWCVLQTGVKLKRGMVNDVLPEKLLLTDGTEVPYGLLVWSTGVGPSPFVRNLQFEKSPAGRLAFFATVLT